MPERSNVANPIAIPTTMLNPASRTAVFVRKRRRMAMPVAGSGAIVYTTVSRVASRSRGDANVSVIVDAGASGSSVCLG